MEVALLIAMRNVADTIRFHGVFFGFCWKRYAYFICFRRAIIKTIERDQIYIYICVFWDNASKVELLKRYLLNSRYNAGTVEFYDRSFDRITTRSEILLEGNNKTFHKVTTTDDPVIRKVCRIKLLLHDFMMQ